MFRLWAPARRRHRFVSGEEPFLRCHIDERASAWPFTDAAIEISPVSRGLYLLYADGQLIYIGAALNGSGIRGELRAHRAGAHGGCTQAATAFLYELADDPLPLHRRYLEAHRRKYGGRVPPGNRREA